MSKRKSKSNNRTQLDLAMITFSRSARARVLVLSARMDAETGRFAAPVSESKELELCSTAILQMTKSQTVWSINVWSEWASASYVEYKALPASKLN